MGRWARGGRGPRHAGKKHKTTALLLCRILWVSPALAICTQTFKGICVLQLPGKQDTTLGPLKIHPLAKVLGNLAPDQRPLGCKDSTAGSRARVHRRAQAGVHRHHPPAKKYSLRACRAEAAVPAHAGEAIHLFTENVSIETPSLGLKMWIQATAEHAFCPRHTSMSSLGSFHGRIVWQEIIQTNVSPCAPEIVWNLKC